MSTIWCLFNTQRRSNGQRSFSTLLHSLLRLGKSLILLLCRMIFVCWSSVWQWQQHYCLKQHSVGLKQPEFSFGKWMLSGVSLLWLRPPDTNSPHVFIHSGRLELLDFHLLWSPLLIRGGWMLYGSTVWNSSFILPLPGILCILLLRISR